AAGSRRADCGAATARDDSEAASARGELDGEGVLAVLAATEPVEGAVNDGLDERIDSETVDGARGASTDGSSSLATGDVSSRPFRRGNEKATIRSATATTS